MKGPGPGAWSCGLVKHHNEGTRTRCMVMWTGGAGGASQLRDKTWCLVMWTGGAGGASQ